jgi:hypothetical protein
MEFKFLRFEARDKYNLCRHLGEADFCGQVKASYGGSFSLDEPYSQLNPLSGVAIQAREST